MMDRSYPIRAQRGSIEGTIALHCRSGSFAVCFAQPLSSLLWSRHSRHWSATRLPCHSHGIGTPRWPAG